jgi:hypothetical protein
MNLSLPLLSLLPWAGSPPGALLRIYGAIGVLSIEMQIVTLAGIGSLSTLWIVNLVVAAAAIAWQLRFPVRLTDWVPAVWRAVPWPAVVLLLGVVLTLNVARPFEAADPYHLERIAQIERFGTLDYDIAADPKINIVGWLYELVVADARLVPSVGGWLARLHGVFGALLDLLVIASARWWLESGGRRGTASGSLRESTSGSGNRVASAWPWIVMLTVPVLFHQLVLIKNDLFIAAPAFTALMWLIARGHQAPASEIPRAAALAGFVVGVKLTNLPVAAVFGVGTVVARWPAIRQSLVLAAVGGAMGAVAGGLVFTLLQNARWYGDLMASGPVGEMGNMARTPAESAVSLIRFGVSLFDMGLLTRQWWPGRGGWGGTYGLPFIWALAVLLASVRHERVARWALAAAGVHFLLFASMFLDADVAHRLALASGLLIVATGAHLAAADSAAMTWARRALVPVIALSTAQILRAAVLYLR